MAQEDALKFLQGELDHQIGRYSQSRDFYRKGCLYVTIFTAALSALTTFLIGASQFFEATTWISPAALATSASITIVAAWDGYYRHREMWVQKTLVLSQLYELRSRLKFVVAREGNSIKTETVDEYYEQYQAVLNGANEAWKGVRTASTGNSQKPN